VLQALQPSNTITTQVRKRRGRATILRESQKKTRKRRKMNRHLKSQALMRMKVMNHHLKKVKKKIRRRKLRIEGKEKIRNKKRVYRKFLKQLAQSVELK